VLSHGFEATASCSCSDQSLQLTQCALVAYLNRSFKVRKFILTVALAAAALVGFSAAANAYTLSPGGAATATSDAPLTFTGPLGITTSCDLELSTNLNTSGNIGDVIGSVSAARLSNCRNATATLVGSGWDIRLTAINGSITSADLALERVGFSVTLLGTTCLYAGTVPINVTQDLGGFNTITVLSNRLTSSSGGICGSGSLNAGQTFSLTPGQTIS
jgi:hypothetical protein